MDIRKLLILLFLILFLSPAHAGYFKCKTMDFNGSPPGLGHYSPWRLLPSHQSDQPEGLVITNTAPGPYIRKLMFPESLTTFFTVYSSWSGMD